MRRLDCHVAFTWWNPVARAERPLPDGVLVRAWERDAFSADDFLGEARTAGGRGQVHIAVEDRDEEAAEVWFELLGEGAALDPAGDALIPAAAADADEAGAPGEAAPLPLPERWSSRGTWTVGTYRRGLFLVLPDEPAIGAPDEPFVFRVFFDCFLQLVYWNERRRAYVGLPAGVPVEACDHELLGPDRVLGAGVTDAEGRVHLRLVPDHEPRPDLYVRYRLPDGTPPAVDLRTGAFAAPGPDALPIPAAWSSREVWRLDEHSARGYWEDFEGSRIGIATNPCVFDVHGGEPAFCPGTRATPLIDGPATLARLEAAIAAAQRSVHVEVMLFFDDAAGRRLAARLAERARAGVAVRVLFDPRTTAASAGYLGLKRIWARAALDLGAAERERLLAAVDARTAAEQRRGDTAALVAGLRAAGVEVRDSSFPWVQVQPAAPPGAPPLYRAVEEALPFFTVARIDHRKLVIVDGVRAFLGGMNVGDEYLHESAAGADAPDAQGPPAADGAPAAAPERWHDCLVELEGPAVAQVQNLFRERWLLEGGAPFSAAAPGPDRAPHATFPDLPVHADGVPVRIVDTTPGARTWVHQQTLGLIDRARREILIENPYFSSREVLHHVLLAALRGVRVAWIFPDHHTDSYDFLYAARLKYAALLAAGVEVYEYAGRMTHAKVAIVDDVSWIGSANMNHASLFNHYEVAAVIADAGWTSRFRAELFERDLAASARIRSADLPRLLNLNALGRAWCRNVVDTFF